MFDSHCHLNDPVFQGALEDVIKNSFEAGVQKIMVVGYDIISSLKALEIAKRYPEYIYAAVGIHPHDAEESRPCRDIKEIEDMAREREVKAIGETGLDFYRNFSSKEKQIESLKAHLDIARARNKPIIFHVRKAFAEIFQILKDNKIRGGIFHCFSGGEKEVRWVMKRGYYISFSGSITYGSKKLEKALRSVPKDKLLIETDAPYLIPRPLSRRNQGRCEPSHLRYTLKKIAKILEIPEEKIANFTYKNSQHCLGLTSDD